MEKTSIKGFSLARLISSVVFVLPVFFSPQRLLFLFVHFFLFLFWAFIRLPSPKQKTFKAWGLSFVGSITISFLSSLSGGDFLYSLKNIGLRIFWISFVWSWCFEGVNIMEVCSFLYWNVHLKTASDLLLILPRNMNLISIETQRKKRAYLARCGALTMKGIVIILKSIFCSSVKRARRMGRAMEARLIGKHIMIKKASLERLKLYDGIYFFLVFLLTLEYFG